MIDAESHLLLTTDRACARITIYDCRDESLLGQIEVGAHPNAIAYNPARHHAFAFNLGEPIGEGCTASVVSLDELRVVATIPLPGRPRWALYEPIGERVFANIREPSEIMVIDAETLNPLPAFNVPAAGPHGLVLTGEQLICAADAGELIAMDRDDGRIVGTAPLPGEPDVVMYDSAADQLFVAMRDPGIIVVVDRPTLHVKSILETERGAHTIGWDPGTRTLYAFLPARCGALVFPEEGG